MNAETWFYIIIVLVSIIISIVSKKQKKLQQQQQRQQQQQKEYSEYNTSNREIKQPVYERKKTDINDFFEMFRETVNNEEEFEEEYKEEQKPEVIEEKEEDAEILDSPVSELDTISEEEVSVIESYDYNKKDEKTLIEEIGKFRLEDFDAKKAVIYSEILNRKNY